MNTNRNSPRDFSRLGVLLTGLLAVIAVALLAYSFLRPGPDPSARSESAALISQIDSAAERDRARRDAHEKARQGLL